MNRLKPPLPVLLAALPLVHLVAACSFSRSDGAIVPGTTLIFCDIEADRHCASNDEIMMGIDISRPFEAGFRIGKSSPIGLDYTPDALAACGGGPRAVVFRDAFPTGTPACIPPTDFGPSPKRFETVNKACHVWCSEQGFYDVVDGEHVPYNCDNVAWQSAGVPGVPPAGSTDAAGFPDQCTTSGILRPDFADPRKQKETNPVVWTSTVGVDVSGSTLTKPPPPITEPGWGSTNTAARSGAVSSQLLTSGNGAVQVTASETNSLRVFGLGTGASSTTFEDVEFGLLMTQAGTLLVVESGAVRINHDTGTAVITTYQTGDRLEVSVEEAMVVYRKNDLVIFSSNVAPTYPLRANAAFNFVGATLTGARVTF